MLSFRWVSRLNTTWASSLAIISNSKCSSPDRFHLPACGHTTDPKQCGPKISHSRQDIARALMALLLETS
eukprot:COSAG01_NODE_920_length_12728_cov_38.396864_5_plen_70_part_00